MNADPDQLTLHFFPDPILRQVTAPVDPIDQTVADVVARMTEIMRGESGLGLAAPQAGLAWRLFICDIPESATEPFGEPIPGTQGFTDGPIICINPSLVDPSPDRSPYDEGCLSLPGIRGDVIRPEVVTLTATGLDGKSFTIRASGLLARCIQHEYDHLDGVLIIDKMTQMSRLKNRSKLKRLQNS
ncbi:MAG TPA: peptide deformylase [Phycisphaerales bacterium]|nr:peptide deformylase [Phycisphaerales bacterium]